MIFKKPGFLDIIRCAANTSIFFRNWVQYFVTSMSYNPVTPSLRRTYGVGWNKAQNHYHQYRFTVGISLHHDTARWFCFDLGDNWDVKTVVVHSHTNKILQNKLISHILFISIAIIAFFEELLIRFWQAWNLVSKRCKDNTEIICVHSYISN